MNRPTRKPLSPSNPRVIRAERDLDKTLAVLNNPPLIVRGIRGHSAESLARALGITEQSAHNRLAKLRERGHRFKETPVKLSFSGPKTVLYSIAKKKPEIAEE